MPLADFYFLLFYLTNAIDMQTCCFSLIDSLDCVDSEANSRTQVVFSVCRTLGQWLLKARTFSFSLDRVCWHRRKNDFIDTAEAQRSFSVAVVALREHR